MHKKINIAGEKKWYVDEREEEIPKIKPIKVIFGVGYIIASIGAIGAFIYFANKNLR